MDVLAKCAGECFLHEIVGANGVAGQRPRIAPKPRDLLFQMVMIIGHDHSSPYFHPTLGGSM
jgi:hypothetical protein